MNDILNIAQIIISILLITTILVQQRGAGLGSAFGGEGGVYYKKRGMEKIIFIATIVLAILFILTAFIRMVI